MPAHHFFHIGTFLLLVASILLLISTISAPVINSISFLKVHTPAGRETFGALGYCTTSNTCSKSHIGYDIAAIISSSSGTTYKNGALENLTKALVLHPVATGVAFIAFLIAAGSHCVGFLFASIIAAIAWVITLVLVVIDFSLFGAAKVRFIHLALTTWGDIDVRLLLGPHQQRHPQRLCIIRCRCVADARCFRSVVLRDYHDLLRVLHRQTFKDVQELEDFPLLDKFASFLPPFVPRHHPHL